MMRNVTFDIAQLSLLITHFLQLLHKFGKINFLPPVTIKVVSLQQQRT